MGEKSTLKKYFLSKNHKANYYYSPFLDSFKSIFYVKNAIIVCVFSTLGLQIKKYDASSF